MKKFILNSICLLVLSLFFIQCNENKGKVKVGIDIPLTGNYAWWGHEFKEGVDIFASQNPDLELIFEDNHGKPNDAVSSANKLLTFSKVDALVTLFAPFSFPIRDIAEKEKVPFISTFNSSTIFTEGYSYSYSDFITNDYTLQLLVKFVTDSMQLSKGIYLCVNDDYGTDGAKIVSKLFEKKNISISGDLFNTGESDFRNFFAKSLESDVQFVFVIARDRDLINAVNQIRERNKDLLILGVGSFDAPVVWEGISEENQNNILFASSYFEKNYNEESKAFFDAFYERNKRNPNYPAVYGYTISQYLLSIIKEAKEKNVPITSLLSKLDAESIRGRLIMTSNRMVFSSIAIYKRERNLSIPLVVEKDMPKL
jgi:ABC-type branched-subunit amino acid transport system substrate-binding protein